MNYATPYELKDNRGNLFVNKKKKVGAAAEALSEEQKKENEKKPHRNGRIRLNGQLFWLSAWEKTTKNGDMFFTVSIGGPAPEDEPTQHSIDKGNGFMPADKKDNMDDEIPF